ncbi:4-alpha-glucanotransferase [Desulfitobacterium chlororespirans DSM 11544]|uniref:4-alpha-glucanotransferase n=1 Tax=Desulfitobacterium chlororespirans DSM 11544 TaxID=1121395 RepID=A0A1M7UQT8_9FIRM|nr:4-alpha-glucanotransferase [Desulfitobacterium chlororespirans DSM 11544]
MVMAYHNSHDPFFRSPFGAVQCSGLLRLRLLMRPEDSSGADSPVQECFLRLWVQDREERLPMIRVEEAACCGEQEEGSASYGRQGTGTVYEAEYPLPHEPGIIWYYFVFMIGGATRFYGNNQEELGGVGELRLSEPPGYQITVYRPMALPSWYTQGIMYQIYVDRFFNGDEQGKVLNPRPRSLIHGDWYDTPFYIKNEKGEVLRWDFFGGNLAGVIKKLPYLKELGVSILYLNPIFDSSSNHKYDTGNYLTLDPMYGDEETFAQLIKEAQSLGIAIILDGVFSHTGDDSIYFNRYGRYPGLGAYQSPDSPYSSWYQCQGEGQEKKYSCWWGVSTLPEVWEMEPSYREFIIHSSQGVLQSWMKRGIKGWRLDVADELPDEFIQEFRQVMKTMDPEGVLIGEVWEDPTYKFSYGKLRQYFWGEELDATMNYPWRNIFLQYFLGQIDAGQAHKRIMNLYENYPRENFFGQMNLIGSHDRARILTLLGEAPPPEQLSAVEQEQYRLPAPARHLAVQRLKLLTLLQMSFPGIPCLYYGDEAGCEGYPDPYNRGTYPWGREDQEILQWFKRVLRYRREYEVLRQGEFSSWSEGKEIYALKRKDEKEEIIVLVNRSAEESAEMTLKLEQNVGQVIDIFAGEMLFSKEDGSESPLDEYSDHSLSLILPPLSAKALFCQKHGPNYYFKQELMIRACGILMHISSLPSPWGIGDLGEEAYAFVDFLAEGGQSLWQVLPLNPLGLGDSPYQSESALAGNPLLISLDLLIQAGLLTEKEARRERAKYGGGDEGAEGAEGDGGKSFARVELYKEKLLRKAYERFKKKMPEAKGYLDPHGYSRFIEENQEWLKDYALYKCLKLKFSGRSWHQWEESYRLRKPEALEAVTGDYAEEINYIFFVQYTFAYQWQRLKDYAQEKGVKMIGDLPIYVAYDSCDTWANRECFALDENNAPTGTAGVPPDYFNPEGQNWGNPLYDWDALRAADYAWWKLRFRQGLERFDALRLDHFRGFEGYWEVPPQAGSAKEGRWLKGPGKEFFESLVRELGPLPVIAEDLGCITPEVNTLRAILGFPGMRVTQFSPLKEEGNYVDYSGTHDNDTLLGWYRSQGYSDKDSLAQVERTIEELYQGNGAWVILPLQDILKLDSQARMNTPGTIKGNWQWRVERGTLTQKVCAQLRSLAEKYGR